MTLSPFEVERREFGTAPLGYRKGEVDHFLDEVRGTVVSLWQERSELREENERLQEGIARYTALEEQLKNTLLLAQDSAEKATEQARRESELALREAGQKAREIVHEAHEERARLETTLRELQSAEQESRQRLRALAHGIVTQLEDSDISTSDASGVLRARVEPSEGRPRLRADQDTRMPLPEARPPRSRPDAIHVRPRREGAYQPQESPEERAATPAVD